MRKERGFPLVDEKGRLQIGTLRDLDQQKLRQWIRAVLSGNDPGVSSGDPAELPHRLLSKVYRQLDALTREAFQDAVAGLLSDLAYGPEWPADAADELLLLLSQVLLDSSRRPQALDLLHQIWTQPASRRTEGAALQRRVLSTLLSLRYVAKPDFWIGAYRSGGSSYASVALHGLALFDIQQAFLWAGQEAKDEAVLQAMARLLPHLVEQHGGERLSALVQGLFKELPEPGRRDLQRIAERAGLRASPTPLAAEEWLEVLESVLTGALSLEPWGGSVVQWASEIRKSSKTSDRTFQFALDATFNRWDEIGAENEAACRCVLELARAFPSRSAFLAVSDYLEALTSQPSAPALKNEVWETLLTLVTNLPYLRRQTHPMAGRPEVLWKRFMQLFPKGLSLKAIKTPAFRMLLRQVDHARLVDIFILSFGEIESVLLRDTLIAILGENKLNALLADSFALTGQEKERFSDSTLSRFLGHASFSSGSLFQDPVVGEQYWISKDELAGGPERSMRQLLEDYEVDAH